MLGYLRPIEYHYLKHPLKNSAVIRTHNYRKTRTEMPQSCNQSEHSETSSQLLRSVCADINLAPAPPPRRKLHRGTGALSSSRRLSPPRLRTLAGSQAYTLRSRYAFPHARALWPQLGPRANPSDTARDTPSVALPRLWPSARRRAIMTAGGGWIALRAPRAPSLYICQEPLLLPPAGARHRRGGGEAGAGAGGSRDFLRLIGVLGDRSCGTSSVEWVEKVWKQYRWGVWPGLRGVRCPIAHATSWRYEDDWKQGAHVGIVQG